MVSILSTLKGFAQDYKTKFKADICDCLEEEISSNARDLNKAYETCFNKSLINYASFIDAEIVEDNPKIKYQKGQKVRSQLKKDFQQEMVYSCDIYYSSIERQRKRLLYQGRAKAYVSDLKQLNQNVATHPTSSAYLLRGLKHFMLENLKEAESDLRKSIEIHPGTTRNMYSKQEHVMLAWVLEEQGRIEEALEVLNKIEIKTYDKETPLLKAIVHRKLGGSKVISSKQDDSSKTIKEQDIKRSQKKDNKLSPKEKANKPELRSLFNLEKKEKDTTKAKTRKRRSRGNR